MDNKCVILVLPENNDNYEQQCIKHSLENNESPLVYKPLLMPWIKHALNIVCYIDYDMTDDMINAVKDIIQMNTNIIYRRLYFPKQIFILIYGEKCSGKSLLADILVDILKEYNKKTNILNLSQAMKKEFCVKYNLDFETLDKYEQRANIMDFMRDEISKNGIYYNVLIWFKYILQDGINIIADIKHSNECNYFLNNYKDNTILIKINSISNVRKYRGWSGYDFPKENNNIDNIKFDIVIDNNGSKQQLINNTKKAIIKHFAHLSNIKI